MKNDRYFKLRIPFATKGHMKQNFDSIVIKGDAIFVFDTVHNHYIDEYLELEEANFRLTDLNMITPTVYYKNKLVKEFRDQYLDQWSNHDPKMIKDESKHQELTNEQIKIVNDFFKKQETTIKKMFSLLSGSNISGAQTNHKASPIRCIDNDFFDCNFANPLKKFQAKKAKLTKNYPNKLSTYTLIDVWNKDLINNFKTIFNHYNQHHEVIQSTRNEKLINSLKEYQDKNQKSDDILDHSSQFKLPENQKLYLDGLENQTLDNFAKLTSNNSKLIKEKLRSFYTRNVNFCLANKIIPQQSMIESKDPDLIENAHILSFSNAFKTKQYRKTIDPFNCLRIDKNTHALFDKLKIYFDKDGNVCSSTDHEIWIPNYIDIKNMHSKTKKYFESQTKKTNKTIK